MMFPTPILGEPARAAHKNNVPCCRRRTWPPGEQEAQLLLGWPLMAHINLIDFHFRDLEITLKAQPRSKVKVYFP